MSKNERKILIFAFLISFLLHAMGLILLKYDTLFSSTANLSDSPKEPPLTLVFQQPRHEPQLQDRFYELLENPSANQIQPERSNILSTKSSVAAAPVITNPGPTAVPKTEAEIQPRASQSETEAREIKPREGTQPIYAFRSQRKFSKNLLASREKSMGDRKARESRTGKTEIRQKEFDPESIGDFALSTYAWNWAPYWLDFKRKLMRNWFAPPAYYRLGLIYGYTIVRFKVKRSGEMFDFRILHHVGHHSLAESSESAIKSTFPFKPLPEDFPDDFLEVTIKMIYPNLRDFR